MNFHNRQEAAYKYTVYEEVSLMGKMTGREDQKENDLFFTCSLIDYIARKTKNKRSDVVDALGKASLEKIYDLADVYHNDNIDRVSDKIDDYNSSFYYEAPQNILNAVLDGRIE